MERVAYVGLDIETNFEWTEILGVGVYTVLRSKTESAYFTDATELFKWMRRMEAKYDDVQYLTWNGSRFDLDKLNKLWDIDIDKSRHIDGMILSKLVDHAIQGGHSLSNVARKCFPSDRSLWKSEIDFHDATPEEIAAYCIQDCKATYHTVLRLLTSPVFLSGGDASWRALRMEQAVAKLCQEQVNKSVNFDIDKAETLVEVIDRQMEMIEDRIEKELPMITIPASKLDRPPKRQFLKSGGLSTAMANWIDRNDLSVVLDKHGNPKELKGADGETYDLPCHNPVITERRASLSRLPEFAKWLHEEKGWVPTEWNYKEVAGKKVKTSPRLTNKLTKEPCRNLKKVGVGYMGEVNNWLRLRSRRNVIESKRGTGWLPTAIGNGGSIASDADTMGANTRRWTHKGIANVPRPTDYISAVMRQLFCARPGTGWVGWDASALEARVEAHYVSMYDKDYADELISGDIHQRNADALGITRDQAKTFKYSVTYGIGAPALAKQLGISNKEAEKKLNEFWSTNHGLRKVKKAVTAYWESTGKKYIKAIDGSDIRVRSEHSLLNALFQSCGAIVMKYAMLLANKDIKAKYGQDAYGLIRYHDEEIWEYNIDTCDPDEIGEYGVASIKTAGKLLGLRVPLEGEYKVGNNWAEVH